MTSSLYFWNAFFMFAPVFTPIASSFPASSFTLGCFSSISSSKQVSICFTGLIYSFITVSSLTCLLKFMVFLVSNMSFSVMPKRLISRLNVGLVFAFGCDSQREGKQDQLYPIFSAFSCQSQLSVLYFFGLFLSFKMVAQVSLKALLSIVSISLKKQFCRNLETKSKEARLSRQCKCQTTLLKYSSEINCLFCSSFKNLFRHSLNIAIFLSLMLVTLNRSFLPNCLLSLDQMVGRPKKFIFWRWDIKHFYYYGVQCLLQQSQRGTMIFNCRLELLLILQIFDCSRGSICDCGGGDLAFRKLGSIFLSKIGALFLAQILIILPLFYYLLFFFFLSLDLTIDLFLVSRWTLYYDQSSSSASALKSSSIFSSSSYYSSSSTFAGQMESEDMMVQFGYQSIYCRITTFVASFFLYAENKFCLFEAGRGEFLFGVCIEVLVVSGILFIQLSIWFISACTYSIFDFLRRIQCSSSSTSKFFFFLYNSEVKFFTQGTGISYSSFLIGTIMVFFSSFFLTVVTFFSYFGLLTKTTCSLLFFSLLLGRTGQISSPFSSSTYSSYSCSETSQTLLIFFFL